MTSASSVIEVHDLTKKYGAEKAVDGLSFTIEANRVTGFLGPNGAGKSTTLRSILGLIEPTDGYATILGRSYRDLDDPASVVGALLETQQSHPQRRARDHLRILAAAAGIPSSRVEEVLADVELTGAARKKVGAFSLGMRQRLGLAAALLGDPQILILDEPANGLDPSGIRWLRGVLKGFARGGKAVLVSSHLLGEMRQIADEVVVIDKGALVTHATVAELEAKAVGGMRVVTTQPERLRDALSIAGVPVTQASESELVVEVDAERLWAIACRADTPITRLQEEHRSLEDVFFELTGAR